MKTAAYILLTAIATSTIAPAPADAKRRRWHRRAKRVKKVRVSKAPVKQLAKILRDSDSFIKRAEGCDPEKLPKNKFRQVFKYKGLDFNVVYIDRSKDNAFADCKINAFDSLILNVKRRGGGGIGLDQEYTDSSLDGKFTRKGDKVEMTCYKGNANKKELSLVNSIQNGVYSSEICGFSYGPRVMLINPRKHRNAMKEYRKHVKAVIQYLKSK